MSVTLKKGQGVSLSKMVRNLSKVRVGLGWQERSTRGDDFDLDASALICTDDAFGRSRFGAVVLSDSHFVFYGNLVAPNGSVRHSGDNLVGGDGANDDEVILVDLNAVEPAVNRIVFVVSIYEAVQRRQSFGQVSNAFIRVVDDHGGSELVRYDLTENYANESAIIFGELVRKDGDWGFNALGTGGKGDLASIIGGYGVNVSS